MTATDPRSLLDALDEAHANATPGEWAATSERADGGAYIDVPERYREGLVPPWIGHASQAADAAGIVAAHNALPALTAAVRAALALADELDGYVSRRGRPAGGSYDDGVNCAQSDAADLIRATVTSALNGRDGVSGRVHELKTWPGPFAAVLDGSKPYEIRPNDRGFCKGDRLRLREWDPIDRRYSGREVTKVVTHVLPVGTFGLRDGHVALGLASLAPVAAEGTDELREALARTLAVLDGAPNPDRSGGYLPDADVLLAGPLAPLLREAAAWRATCAVIDDGQRVIAEGNDRALGGESRG